MEPNELICTFGATVLLKHLTALRQEIEGVRHAEDIEAIHRMRVASRRLRAALPLFDDCFRKKQVDRWTREIKGITAALGAARDTDVQLDLLRKLDAELDQARLRPGLRRLILRISTRRQELQNGVIKALDRLDEVDFYSQMEADLLPFRLELPPGTPLPHDLFIRSEQAIRARLDDFFQYEAFIRRPECIAELHAMRIAAKRLRYTMETFASLYPEELSAFIQAVKNAQELLGNVHDCDVWLVYLPEFNQDERQRVIEYYGHANPFHPLIPGLKFFMENRQQEREHQYQEFIKQWEKWAGKNLWNRLQETIEAPVYRTVFPLPPDRFVPAE